MPEEVDMIAPQGLGLPGPGRGWFCHLRGPAPSRPCRALQGVELHPSHHPLGTQQRKGKVSSPEEHAMEGIHHLLIQPTSIKCFLGARPRVLGRMW